ncbi:M4 family metallopeptidase [Cohnella rhizosphaerae]|uniref:M4 family metallopeptidase n=1 Tax=Cohnella rhizosphaerae TaxID=1457232 RepID=A0A9X4KUR7_9BACL|nr:M4 family metallopeptidase [Cohnella rhizosphaerae]MDG0808462.1 M4 family metallopeptidase [Cohnella rhizosphaerae]
MKKNLATGNAAFLSLILFLSFVISGMGPRQADAAIPSSGLQNAGATGLQSDADVLAYFGAGRQRIASAADSLQIVGKSVDMRGKTHYRIQQYYKGIPVYGSYITAHLDGGRNLYAATNETDAGLAGLALDSVAVLSEEDAIAALRTAIGQAAQDTARSDAPEADSVIGAAAKPTAQLLFYPVDENTYMLAYKVELSASQPALGRWYGFIDARSGEVLKKLSRSAEAAAEGIAITGNGYLKDLKGLEGIYRFQRYYLVDTTKPMYGSEQGIEWGTIETYDASNLYEPVSALSQNFGNANPEAIDAHYYAGQVYDFYRNRFGRNSLDDNGMSILSVVNAGPIDNAFWDGSVIWYGDGNESMACLSCASDVVAHELTHAVTEHTASLEYSGQSGALNESFSDIFAAVFDDDDWLIGEDAGIVGGHGFLRSLQHPEDGLSPQPSNMSGYAKLPEDDGHDNGGVHTNSGIPNRAAYLISEGIDGIPGLEDQGRRLLGDIAYGALTSYLTPTAQFADARDAFVLAAGDLDLSDTLRSAVIDKVKSAWEAVGLGYTGAENAIVSLDVPGLLGPAAIDAAAGTVIFKAAYGTDLSKLSAAIGISPGASISPDPKMMRSYASPVVFRVTAKDGTARDWTVSGAVADPLGANDITAFNLEMLWGRAIIDAASHTVTVYAESDDDLSALTPRVTVSEGATVTPASGAQVNLNSEQVYTVSAQNGSKQRWTVRAIKDSSSPKAIGGYTRSSTMIVLGFDEAMDTSTLGNAASYTVKPLNSSLSSPKVLKVEKECASSSIVYLTLDRPLASNEAYQIIVANARSAKGMALRPDAADIYVQMDDTEGPVLGTARAAGNKLTLTYDEPVVASYTAVMSFMRVELNGSDDPIAQWTVEGRHLVLTLTNPVKAGDVAKFSYKPASSSGALVDMAGNPAAAVSGTTALNRTAMNAVSGAQDWARFSGEVKQMIQHPTLPIVYAIFKDSNQVAAVNLSTGETAEATMDRQPERLYAANGKLYVALVDRPHSSYWWVEDQTGALAVLNEQSLAVDKQFTVDTDPFDLIVTPQNSVFIASGSGQWTNLTSYNGATGDRIDSRTISQASYLAYVPQLNKVYAIDTDSSPRDIEAFEINAAGTFLTADRHGYSSPYHGDYPMFYPLWATPDGKHLFNRAGTVFSAASNKQDDMLYEGAIDAFDDIAFEPGGTGFYTLNGHTVNKYDDTDHRAVTESYPVGWSVTGILPGYGGRMVYVRTDEMGATLTRSPGKASPTAGEQPSILASDVYSAIHPCPLPASGSGGGDGGSNSGGSGSVGGGGSGGGGAPPAGTAGADDGKTASGRLGESDLHAEKQVDSQGRSILVLQPEGAKLEAAFKAAQKEADDYAKQHSSVAPPRVVLPVASLADGMTVRLDASSLIAGTAAASKAVVVLQSDKAEYELPVSLLTGNSLKQAWGSQTIPSDLRIVIKLQKSDLAVAGKVGDLLKSEGLTSLSDALDFDIVLESGDVSKTVSNFGGTYVTKRFIVGDTADLNGVSALTYDAAAGSMTFVPSLARIQDGKLTVEIKTPHNSVYTIVRASKSFADLANRPDRSDIEAMAARKLVLGTGQRFEPDRAVTRAEFAALLVRALGLAPQTGGSAFADVVRGSWYEPSVTAAVNAGLVTGYGNGKFIPSGVISRQEMAVMLKRAATFAGGLPASDAAQSAPTIIGDPIAAWAEADVRSLLEAGILERSSAGSFEPAKAASRSTATIALKRLLEKLQLINE